MEARKLLEPSPYSGQMDTQKAILRKKIGVVNDKIKQRAGQQGVVELKVGGATLQSRALNPPELERLYADFEDMLGDPSSTVRRLFLDRAPEILAFIGHVVSKENSQFRGSRAGGTQVGWELGRLRPYHWGTGNSGDKNMAGTSAAFRGSGSTAGWFWDCTSGTANQFYYLTDSSGVTLDDHIYQLIFGVEDNHSTPAWDFLTVKTPHLKSEIPFSIGGLRISDTINEVPIESMSSVCLLGGEEITIRGRLVEPDITDDRLTFLGISAGKASTLNDKTTA